MSKKNNFKNFLKSKGADDVRDDFMKEFGGKYYHNKSYVVSAFKVIDIKGSSNEQLNVVIKDLRTDKTVTSPYKDFFRHWEVIPNIKNHIVICDQYIESIKKLKNGILKEIS